MDVDPDAMLHDAQQRGTSDLVLNALWTTHLSPGSLAANAVLT